MTYSKYANFFTSYHCVLLKPEPTDLLLTHNKCAL